MSSPVESLRERSGTSPRRHAFHRQFPIPDRGGGYLRMLRAFLRDVGFSEIEIQPYHKLGVHKWKELGWDYQLKDARENTENEIETAKEILRPYFKSVVVN